MVAVVTANIFVFVTYLVSAGLWWVQSLGRGVNVGGRSCPQWQVVLWCSWCLGLLPPEGSLGDRINKVSLS